MRMVLWWLGGSVLVGCDVQEEAAWDPVGEVSLARELPPGVPEKGEAEDEVHLYLVEDAGRFDGPVTLVATCDDGDVLLTGGCTLDGAARPAFGGPDGASFVCEFGRLLLPAPVGQIAVARAVCSDR